MAQVPPSSPLPSNSPGSVPPTWASCPGGEEGQRACGAGGRGSKVRGEGSDAPHQVLQPRRSRAGCGSGVGNFGGVRWGGGWAEGREWPAAVPRLSGRRAGCRRWRGPAGSRSRRCYLTARSPPTTCTRTGSWGEWRGIGARQSLEVRAAPAGDEAAPGAVGGPLR